MKTKLRWFDGIGFGLNTKVVKETVGQVFPSTISYRGSGSEIFVLKQRIKDLEDQMSSHDPDYVLGFTDALEIVCIWIDKIVK